MKHALLRTLPGRAIVVGAAVEDRGLRRSVCVGALPPAARRRRHRGVGRDRRGRRLLPRARAAFAKRRLLWRVRRKLIISYIFIGFIPAILIVAFFLLGGLLLFSNFSSYLVQSRLRKRSTSARPRSPRRPALEIQRAGGRDMPGDPRAPRRRRVARVSGRVARGRANARGPCDRVARPLASRTPPPHGTSRPW